MGIEFTQYNCPLTNKGVEAKIVDGTLVYINCGKHIVGKTENTCLGYSRNQRDSKPCPVQRREEKSKLTRNFFGS